MLTSAVSYSGCLKNQTGIHQTDNCVTDKYVIVGIQHFQEFFRRIEGFGLVCSSQEPMDQDYTFTAMVF